MKKDIIGFFIVIAFSVFLITCSSSDNQSSENTPGKASQGSSSPATVATFLAYDIEGNLRSFDEFRGKSALILNFWGTWCPPCRREMPDLKRIYSEYKPKGLEIIGLAVNDTPQRVKAYVAQFEVDWVMLMASRESLLALQVGSGIPTTIFIDRSGAIRGRYVGMRTYEDFKVEVEKII